MRDTGLDFTDYTGVIFYLTMISVAVGTYS